MPFSSYLDTRAVPRLAYHGCCSHPTGTCTSTYTNGVVRWFRLCRAAREAQAGYFLTFRSPETETLRVRFRKIQNERMEDIENLPALAR